jgi:ABC-type multidrug transport system fused ATPase/permease subunit
VPENGKIVEQGTHEQLRNNNSLYAAQVRAV